MTPGYYRTPTVFGNQVVFVCEDDLWLVPLEGGVARRITSNLGIAAYPKLSPDGSWLAFSGTEEGESEVYVMPAIGGAAKRITYLGADQCRIAGWTKDGKILFSSDYGQPFRSMAHLFEVNTDGTDLEKLNFGPASTIGFGPNAGVVVGRNTDDPARWKRYRGGKTGQLWIDREGDGLFDPLIQLAGNLASPMWIEGRIFFLSDHEGIGNLYSCSPKGDDLQRHSDYNTFYVRNASTDGRHIVYHAGGDLYAYDVNEKQIKEIPVVFLSPQTQRNRKFVSPARFLESWNLHPKGQAVAITARGKLFSFFNWEGAILPHGEQNGVRYRLPVWLNDGKQILAVTDVEGEERFVLFSANGSEEAKLLPEMDMGRPMRIVPNPRKAQVAFSNHRFELFCLDLEDHRLQHIDKGTTAGIRGFTWSPDGEWLAYSLPVSHHVTLLKLWQGESGQHYPLTRPVLHDIAPAFDPDGKYLYFLSYRHFNPVYDNLHFDLSFPGGMKPYLITLQKDLPSPFRPVPKFSEEDGDEKEEEQTQDSPDDTEIDNQGEGEKTSSEGDIESEETQVEPEKQEEKKIQIDLDGIEDRVMAFPIPDGLYGRVMGIADGKVLYSRYPIEGELDKNAFSMDSSANGTLLAYSFENLKEETLIQGVTTFDLSLDAKTLIYLSGQRLRVLPAGKKPNREAKDKPGKESGWLNLWRVKVPVVPLSEWKQMFKEAWRLQRDHFWVEDMSKVDWLQVYQRYLPLVDRVSCRSEFSDLMWEMQGELGTSHAYEFGGDYRPAPFYSLGLLGAAYAYDKEHDGWRITHIVKGDSWDENSDSPLNAPGVNVKQGDVLLSVNGMRLGKEVPPGVALVNLARNEVLLTILSQENDEAEPEAKVEQRIVTVKTIANEMPAYYREWVESNRAYVHEVTQGRVGYVHIPGMMAPGYAEFHRGFLAEVDREGLVVDVRFNTGGHVSALILEKLARRRIGYDTSRWSSVPEPYPPESVLGPMVALTNEYAGSDGDIFSHSFKLMGLGPLIGKRTWGGVIGISPKQILVDRTITTQPEFSFWFQDVGWGVENYGTDPDIEVENLPQDYARGLDAQLVRAIEEVVKLMEANPPLVPDFGERPSRSLPRLPKR